MENTINTKSSLELKLDAEAVQLSLNTALNEDSFSDITRKRDELKKAVGNYNEKAKLENFVLLRDSVNPMLSAIEKLTYGTMSIREEKDKDTGIIIRYILEASTSYIDLLEFEKFCEGKKIATSTAWKYMLEKFNFVLALRIAKDLGIDYKTVEKRYSISQEAYSIDKDNKPISNTKMLSQLQAIVDAIIYKDADGKNAYKVTSHDVAFLLNTLTSIGKTKHGVRYANASTTRNLIARMLNKIIEDEGYNLEYVTKKDAEKEAEKENK